MTHDAMGWKAPPAPAVDEEDGGPSSISDVFADMLNVNEDMIVAAAECQAERNVEGTIAYQRILHRNLLEMADFIDAMFGVYSSSSSSSDTPGDSAKDISDSERCVGEELLLEAATDGDAAAGAKNVKESKTRLRTKKTPSALLTTLEAGEKVREIQRSNEQWRKARHQVLEEEGVGVVMKGTSETEVEVAAKEGEPPPPGLALVAQMRAHQQLLALMEASSGSVGAAPSMAALGFLLANPLAVPAAMQPLAAPAPAPSPPLPRTAAPVGQQIQPATVGTSLPKIALPPAHSFFNLLFPLAPPPLLLNPQAAGGFGAMPWQQPPLALQAARSSRPMVPVCGPDPTAFKRMCEECRKCHFSVRRCRLVLQHTAPEWQPTQTQPPVRRRRRKARATTLNDSVM